ncbi:hypothetical protein PDUR_08350 [Paenibacillus durus]|uniref:Uncharacterized protein n=2 Tax=Paenibacillus durus TaxID=44251 RepID=A0A089HMM7_PAEDU|nr:hypothetical protein PDUR_08350 [Paenibacillus durus]
MVSKPVFCFIDRFEGDLAIIEVKGATQDIPRSRLPRSVKPGDAVIMDGLKVRLDRKRKAAREKEIYDLMYDVWEDLTG